MKIYCPECGSLVAAEDLNLENGLAKCRGCQSVFSYADAARLEEQRCRQPPGGSPVGSSKTTLLPRPARMQIEEFAGTWVVSWRWFSPLYIFLTFFCVTWDGFLFAWYGFALHNKHLPWLFVAFPFLHVAVGVILTYTVLCGFINHTRISVDARELNVYHGPLPWFGGGRFGRSEVQQLYCEEKVSGSRNNSTTVNYNLMLMLRDGTKRKLVAGLGDGSDAKFLEQQIEQRLRITDQPVVGEYR